MSENLSVDKKNAIRILDYWFLMEFLNQQSIKPFKKIGEKTSGYKRKLNSRTIKNPYKIVDDFIEFKYGDTLKTITKKDSEEMNLPLWSDFTVFIGCIKREFCIQKIAQNVDWSSQNPDEDEKSDEIALAIIKFSKDGNYIKNSLSISPLAWAMKTLSGGTSDASQKLSIEGYRSEIKSIEEQIKILFKSCDEDETCSSQKTESAFGVQNIVSYKKLKNVEDIIYKKLDLKVSDEQSFLSVYFKLYASEKDRAEDEYDVSLHMDFYSEDLAFVVDGLRNNVFTKEKEKMLIDYILGLSRYGIGSDNAPHRFDVIKPKNEEDLYQFMADNLTAAKAPIGKWPSKFMPALMQQIAINMAISEDVDLPIFSVNGPPGTGKTTLLKEVIVSNIVEKARILADYEDPDEAFDDYLFKNGDGPNGSYNQYVRKYHRLKNKKINAYSVLVVSNNNTAVENITKELPVEAKILEDIRPSKEIKGQNDLALAELSKLFTVSESTGKLPFTKKYWENYIDCNGKKKQRHKEVVANQPDIYFSRLATDLLNAEVKTKSKQQAFGLISATLGKKSNIDKVETNVIRPLLDIMKKNDDITQRKQNYLDARQKFLLQLELVLQLQIKLDEVPVKEKEVAKLRKKVEKIKSQEKAHQKKQQSLLPEIDRNIHNQQECISELGSEKKKTKDRISSIHAVCTDFETKIKNQQDDMTAIQSGIDKLETNISILDRLFKNAKYKEVHITIDHERKKKIQCQKEIEALNKALFNEKQKEISEQNELNKLLGKINIEEKK